MAGADLLTKHRVDKTYWAPKARRKAPSGPATPAEKQDLQFMKGNITKQKQKRKSNPSAPEATGCHKQSGQGKATPVRVPRPHQLPKHTPVPFRVTVWSVLRCLRGPGATRTRPCRQLTHDHGQARASCDPSQVGPNTRVQHVCDKGKTPSGSSPWKPPSHATS